METHLQDGRPEESAISMKHETQSSITQWGEETFGPVADLAALARRARTEMDELIEALEAGDHTEAKSEAADVLILLSRLAHMLGFKLSDAVNEKMEINRARKWTRAEDGTGSHID
jgi:NTP pyrophosphatase (non-canonical NTP hydrolase)